MMKPILAACAVLVSCIALTPGCSPGPGRRQQADTTAADSIAGDVVDSILPMAEYVKRFRQSLPAADTLSGGARSEKELVEGLLRALSSRDRSALIASLLSKSEFAWLYFPRHIYAEPPYELDPAIFWLQIQAGSDKGYARLLEYRGGLRLEYVTHTCKDATTVSPPLHERNQCDVTLLVDGQRRREQLFGSIVEFEGRYKFVSYSNQF